MPNDNPSEGIEQQAVEQIPASESIDAPTPPNDPDAPNAETVSQQEVTAEIHGLEDRIRGAEKWMIGLTGDIVLLTAGIVIVGVLQWSAMRGQLAEMKSGGADTKAIAVAAGKQADSTKELAGRMKDQADATERLAEAAKGANGLNQESMRGRMAIKGIRLQKALKAGELISVVVEVENIGHSAASVKSGSQSEHWTLLPDGPMRLKKKNDNGRLEPGIPLTFIIFDKSPATADFIDGIGAQGTPTIFFFGRIDYESLRERHSEEFCAFLIRMDTGKVAVSPATTGVGVDPRFALYQCPKWHGADQKGQDPN